MIPFSIDGIDVALQSVVAIVKIRYHQIELFNHGFANYADVIGVAHKDKIIAARIADEPLYSGKLTVDCRKNGLLKRILAYVSNRYSSSTSNSASVLPPAEPVSPSTKTDGRSSFLNRAIITSSRTAPLSNHRQSG